MSKKKKKQSSLPPSPRQYIRTRGRSLPVAECIINENWKETGMANVFVTRRHKSGNYTVGVYLVDIFCLGLKDTFFRFNVLEGEYEEFKGKLVFSEITYGEAHNIIYGAIEYAGELGIPPHKDFDLTQYLLEEDTEDIPLIEYEFGNNGKPLLMVKDRLELSHYQSILAKSTGGDFEYAIRGDGDFDEDEYGGYGDGDEDGEEENGGDRPDQAEMFQKLERMKTRLEHSRSLPHTVYAYTPPDYPKELTLTHGELNVLFRPENVASPDRETLETILALPRESLIRDLIHGVLYEIGHTNAIIAGPSQEEWPESVAITIPLLLLGELRAEESLDAVLEIMRQNEDFLNYHFGDFAVKYLPLTLYYVGRNRLPALLDFAREPGLYTFLKAYVFPAVAMIAVHEPERRGEVIAWFREVLDFCHGHLSDATCYDAGLAGMMTNDLIDIQAVELLPEIKRLYDTGLVDEMCCGNYAEVEKEILSSSWQSTDFTLLNIYERYEDPQE